MKGNRPIAQPATCPTCGTRADHVPHSNVCREAAEERYWSRRD